MNTDTFFECVVKEDCIGGLWNQQCRDYHTGPLCSVCIDEHARLQGKQSQCQPCLNDVGSFESIFSMICGVLIFIFIGALLFLSWPDHIYYKMKQHAATTAAAKENEGSSKGLARQATDKHVSQKKDDAMSDVTGANESNAAVSSSLDTTSNNLNKVSRTKIEKLIGHFKIIIGFVQIFSSLQTTFSIPWPDEFVTFLSFPPFKMINIDIIGLFGSFSPCDFTVPFTTRFIFHILILPFFGCISLLAYAVAVGLRRCNISCKHRFVPKSARERMTTMVVAVVFLLFPGLTVKIFQLFKCTELDSELFVLVADMSMECSMTHGPWKNYATIGLISIIIYVLGIPISSWFILRQNKNALYNINHPKQESMEREYGSLYLQYEPTYYWWESLEMVKKCLLTGGLVLVAPGSSAQVMFGALIALTFLLLVLKASPYEEDDDDKLQFIATLAILLTLLGGFALKTDNPEEGLYEKGLMGVLLVTVNAVVLIAGGIALMLSFPCISTAVDRWHEKRYGNKKKTTKVVPENGGLREWKT